MLNAFRLARTTQYPSLISTYTNLPYNITRKPSNIRFAQAASGPNQEMNRKEERESKARDTMSSLGEGYATRADEEGFGGIYGGNQYLSKDEEDRDKGPKHAQGDHEKEFDQSQGSEVKEKETARNQSKAVTN